jgi:hypothetical protein
MKAVSYQLSAFRKTAACRGLSFARGGWQSRAFRGIDVELRSTPQAEACATCVGWGFA